MNITEATRKIILKKDLLEQEMQEVMQDIMSGKTSNIQISGFLIGLATKGESVSEIVGATKVMRKLALPIKLANNKNVVDTCGTGGDGKSLFNISTASAFVAATAGARVAKHGNRSISSKSGSADVLELSGANLTLNPTQISNIIDKIGIGFIFAQLHHSAMKYAIEARQGLALRTIFNILGPLTNPASAPNQVLGVYDKQLLQPMIKTLQKLGSNQVLVVHSNDGLDEISIADTTHIAELKNNSISYYSIRPEDFGIQSKPLNSIKVNSAKESLKLIQESLSGKDCPARDIIALNAGGAIYVSGIASSIKSGISMAQDILKSGAAYTKLNNFIEETNIIVLN